MSETTTTTTTTTTERTLSNGWIRVKGRPEPEYNPEIAALVIELNRLDREVWADVREGL